MFWGVLVHIGYNLYLEESVELPAVFHDSPYPYFQYSPQLQVDDRVWRDLVDYAADNGVTAMVLDLADGIRYDSHPEIAVENAWSTERLRDEIAGLRQRGIEPLPKLNFGAGHDIWLKEYSRQVSTPVYYAVVDDLIDEVGAIFDGPRFFHLGMDEETYDNQRYNEYVTIRQGDLWWNDLLRMVGRVEANGSRAWVWSDAAWHNPREYYRRMPTSVLQSNWYYNPGFAADETGRPKRVNHDDGTAYMTYLDLQDAGFDQVPTGSVFPPFDNMVGTAEFARDRLDPARLVGMLNSVWVPPLESTRHLQMAMIDRLAEARDAYEGKRSS